MATIDDQLSYAVIGCAMEAHRELGPGLDEALYHELMARRLTAAGIAHQVKPRGQLRHRNIVADEFEADLIVDGRLAVELKVLWGGFAPEHILQLICYLKFWRLDAGLLFDFGKESLSQKRVPRIDRAVNCVQVKLQHPESCGPETQALVDQITEAVYLVMKEHGLGYRDTTYRGLLFAELTYQGVSCVRDPIAPIHSAGSSLGESRLPCLVLPGHGVLLVTALRESRQAADRAVLQTCLRHLGLPWGVLANFGKTSLDCDYVRAPNAHGK